MKEKIAKGEQKAGLTQRPERTTKDKEDEFQKKEEGVVDDHWDREMDRRSRCGGCINHRETFLHNPQVQQNDHKRTFNVLLQPNQRSLMKA